MQGSEDEFPYRISLIDHLRLLRQQRFGMITHKSQYVFCYEALLAECKRLCRATCTPEEQYLCDQLPPDEEEADVEEEDEEEEEEGELIDLDDSDDDDDDDDDDDR